MLSADELKTAIKLLKDSKPVTDGVIHTAIPGKKRSPKVIAYDKGYVIRSEVAATGEFALADLKVRTWADGDGYRFAIVLK